MTSNVKPVQLARLGWLPRQANLLLHDGLHLKTVWFLAPNSKTMPLAMKCQVNSEKSQIFQNTKPTLLLLGKLVATYNFAASLFCTVQSLFRTFFCPWQLVPVLKLYFLHNHLCCKDLASNGPNNKQGLEEQ